MKKLIFILIALVGLGLVISCEKETQDPRLDMSLTEAPAISSPAEGSEYILDREMVDSQLFVVQWSEAVYDLTTLESTKYLLEAFSQINDSTFKSSTLASGTSTSFGMTVGAMNSLLVSGWQIPPDSSCTLSLRVRAFINDLSDYSYVYSNVVNITVTPYADVVTYPCLYVPGDYQGWSPATAPKVYDFDGDGIYNGYIVFPEGGTLEFKFTSDPDWDHTNYGSGGAGILSTDNGAGNLKVPQAGGYKFEVDVNALTWTMQMQNWGVIGEWLAWATDIDMNWDIVSQDLSVTVENIPAADNQRFKYRANDAWDINLGAKDPDDGTLVQGGADIPIPNGGTITFILKFTTPEPTYSIITK